MCKHVYIPDYLGYYEIYGNQNIERNILSKIPNKAAPIIVVGHSLGGWNGAHLSGLLHRAGYRVEMLITLDPVGEGTLVVATSDIYSAPPKAAAKYWINIRAETSKERCQIG